jgi:hypothetical protein
LDNLEILGKVSVKVSGAGAEFYTVEGSLSEKATLQEFLAFTKKSLIGISLDALRLEQERGFERDPVVVVDGRKNKSILDVSPLGKIQFIAKAQGTTLLFDLYQDILAKSKVVTGTYLENNFVMYNSKVVATNTAELISWLAKVEFTRGDTIRFVNVTPYARKLERSGVRAGITKERLVKTRDKKQRSGPLVQAPNGVYFLAHRAISRKYKQNVEKMKFIFLTGNTLGIQNYPVISKRTNKPLGKNFVKRGNQKKSGPYLYPTIQIVIGESGVI